VKAKPLPSQATLRELLDYDPDTGVLTWRERGRDWFSSTRICNAWNSRYAGKEAGRSMPRGYISVGMGKGHYLAHRLIHCWMTGLDPGSFSIDHINHTTSDNRWDNLRLVSGNQINMKNASRRSDNRSGITGVSWNAKENKWQVHITVGGRSKRVGGFACIKEAAAAREAANAEYGYHENHGRTV